MSAEETLKKVLKKQRAERLRIYRENLKEIEAGVEEQVKNAKTIKELRQAVFGGKTDEAISRAGILMTLMTVQTIMNSAGLLLGKPIVSYVRKRAQPSATYLVSVFDKISLEAIEKLNAHNKEARKRLEKLKSVDPANKEAIKNV